MTETPTPLPCPFCGFPLVGVSIPADLRFKRSVKCPSCHSHGGWGNDDAEALTAWNTRADSHHRLVEALEPFAFVGEDYPSDTQAVWEMIYRDRVHDWFSYEDFERARDLLAALKEAGRGGCDEALG